MTGNLGDKKCIGITSFPREIIVVVHKLMRGLRAFAISKRV